MCGMWVIMGRVSQPWALGHAVPGASTRPPCWPLCLGGGRGHDPLLLGGSGWLLGGGPWVGWQLEGLSWDVLQPVLHGM